MIFNLKNMNTLIKLTLCISVFSFSSMIFSQQNGKLDIIDRDVPQRYALSSIGLTNPIYRDFATSPLFYSGIGIEISRAWMKRSEERERNFGIGFGISFQTARIPESNFIQPGSIAGFGKFDIFYQELWKIEALSDSKNNTKVGGVILVTQNIRGNPELQNNILGLENISNLMASAQWTRDISRTENKILNLWLWKPTLKPVKRDLRFLLNVGVLNFNYRPGYAYAYDSELNGMETNPVKWAYSNFKWSLNGWRIKTQLEYIQYMPNGNARSLSYVWEASNVPGKFENFQMAIHQLRYTVYFNCKKR